MSTETTPTPPADPLQGIKFPVYRPCPPEEMERMRREFRTYLRELPRLLAEGHAWRYAIVHGDEVLSVWDTASDAIQAKAERFGLEPVSIKQVDPRDPERLEIIRTRQKGTS